MTKLSRRGAIRWISVGGLALATLSPHQDDTEQSGDETADERRTDRDRIMDAGMTEAEADCWESLAECAGKILNLPTLHSMEEHEVAHAVHVLQHRLLARPTYRRYLEIAKAELGERPARENNDNE